MSLRPIIAFYSIQRLKTTFTLKIHYVSWLKPLVRHLNRSNALRLNLAYPLSRAPLFADDASSQLYFQLPQAYVSLDDIPPDAQSFAIHIQLSVLHPLQQNFLFHFAAPLLAPAVELVHL